MQELRDLRLQIDKAINSTTLLMKSREVSLCHTNLQRAKAWLGKCLGELGTENPYPQSSNAENTQIEAQAEHGEENFSDHFQPASQQVPVIEDDIKNIKAFRGIIQEITTEAEGFQTSHAAEELPMKFRLFYQQSVLALIEAKMWLGWALDAIRKNQ